MNLNPALGRTDRIGSLAVGVGLVMYGFLGGFEQVWIRGALILLGLAFAAGGIGGT